MHEVITLQLGQQSNYLATHFWNAQESYFTYSPDQEPLIDHDIHWRPGIGADGSETFMPRTVIYDLKGGFGSLKQINALYEMEEDGPPQGAWGGRTVVDKQTPIEASAYQQSLDTGLEPPELTPATVRYWSDFSRVFYHPRSAVQLNEYGLNSSLAPFERWSTGEDLFASLDKEHDIVDRDVRPFVEEADQMQGIQIFATLDDAWGGFAARYLERLRDEYGKTAIWVWGLQDSFRGVARDKRLLRLANKARTLTEAYKQASLVIPMALPQVVLPRTVSIDPSSRWHSSALLASAMETATVPFRLKNQSNRETYAGMTAILDGMGKQTVASLQLSVDLGEDGTRRSTDDDGGSENASRGTCLDIDFSPTDEIESAHRQNGYRKPHIFGQAVTSRGPEREEAKVEDDEDDEEDRRNRRQRPGDLVYRRYHSELAFPMLDSFPRIFKDGEGSITKDPVPLTASLSTDSSVSEKLKLLRSTVTRSIGLEDRELLSNDLAEMADEYHEGWSSGSDFGDDED